MTLKITVTDDLETCLALRHKVFIEEQNVSETDERDGRDVDAVHLLATLHETPVGTARILISGDTGKIGRVCVIKPHRGTGLGIALIQTCLDVLRDRGDIKTAKLGAQTHAIGFYEKLGFRAYGPEYDDAGIPHRDMMCTL